MQNGQTIVIFTTCILNVLVDLASKDVLFLSYITIQLVFNKEGLPTYHNGKDQIQL